MVSLQTYNSAVTLGEVDIEEALKAGQAVEPEREIQFCAATEVEYSAMRTRRLSSVEIPSPGREIISIIASRFESVIVGTYSILVVE